MRFNTNEDIYKYLEELDKEEARWNNVGYDEGRVPLRNIRRRRKLAKSLLTKEKLSWDGTWAKIGLQPDKSDIFVLVPIILLILAPFLYYIPMEVLYIVLFIASMYLLLKYGHFLIYAMMIPYAPIVLLAAALPGSGRASGETLVLGIAAIILLGAFAVAPILGFVLLILLSLVVVVGAIESGRE